MVVNCANQAEIDYYWDRLTADGGKPSMCGWLSDRFGVPWQVVPEQWMDLMESGNQADINRAMASMFTMQKLEIAPLMAAFEGK